nr:DUF5723 family protein [Allomuricauda sp.]
MFSKKIIFSTLLFLTVYFIKAQSYGGLLTDNYSGIHGIISNPANIADSRLKLDVNLFGVSALFSNDYIGFNLSDAFSDFSEAFDNAATSPSNNNFLAWNTDILGPSVMLSIDEKQSFSVFTRVRAVFNLYDVNGGLLEREGGFDENEDFFINEGDVNGSFNLWGEIGATYARVLLNDGKNFIKGGLTLKYIQGMGNVYINGSNVTLDYDATNRY